MDLSLKELAQFTQESLHQMYGSPLWSGYSDPLDELISTILSQNTNDRNRDAAFNQLRRKFPTWEAVRDAEPGSVIEAIRTAGLANQKGPRIQAILKKITIEHGSLHLTFLRQWQPQEVRDWLMKLNGVGPKTAAIVMVFSLGMPAFPVDTHIYRVSGRIGLRPAGMTVEQAHAHLAELFPPQAYGEVHLNLIRLGREICHPRRPQCHRCPLQSRCYYAKNQIDRVPKLHPDRD